MSTKQHPDVVITMPDTLDIRATDAYGNCIVTSCDGFDLCGNRQAMQALADRLREAMEAGLRNRKPLGRLTPCPRSLAGAE